MTGDSVEPVEPALEGRVLEPGEPLRAPSGMRLNADHWPAFQPVRLVGEAVWHDEAQRLEERGRLDRAGCECDDCLADKYSGEDFY